jgi:hypothetical protein
VAFERASSHQSASGRSCNAASARRSCGSRTARGQPLSAAGALSTKERIASTVTISSKRALMVAPPARGRFGLRRHCVERQPQSRQCARDRPGSAGASAWAAKASARRADLPLMAAALREAEKRVSDANKQELTRRMQAHRPEAKLEFLIEMNGGSGRT